jgi:hypothetical protein
MNDRLPHPDVLLRSAAGVVLGAVVASGLLLAVAGVDLVEWLEWAPRCVLRGWTGIACPGCGMTQALVRLGQLELGAALQSNLASPLMLAAIAWKTLPPRVRQ